MISLRASFFGFFLFIVLLFLSILSVSFNPKFYEHEFASLGVHARFGEQATNEHHAVIGYLLGKGELSVGFFNEREIAHLRDVRSLVRFSFGALFFGALSLICLASYSFWKEGKSAAWKIIARGLLIGGSVGIIFCVFALLSILLGFDSAFSAFHTSLFEGESYLFDPSTENIVNLYPERLFFDLARAIGVFFLSLSLLFVLVGYSLLKRQN